MRSRHALTLVPLALLVACSAAPTFSGPLDIRDRAAKGVSLTKCTDPGTDIYGGLHIYCDADGSQVLLTQYKDASAVARALPLLREIPSWRAVEQVDNATVACESEEVCAKLVAALK